MANEPCTLYTCNRCGHVVGTHSDDALVEPSGFVDSLSLSNNPPTLIEQSALQREYDDLRRISAALDNEIARLRASLEAFEKKKNDTDARLSAYRSALSPYRRLPIEILRIIFELCVEEDANINARLEYTSQFPDSSSTLDIDKCPWALSQVCRGWRNLVVSLPALWTAIDMNWTEGEGKLPDALVERRLSLMLQRSRDQPLLVSWFEHSCTEKAVSLLCSSTFRWSQATIRADIEGLSWLAPYSGLFPALSTLRVNFESDGWFTEDETSTILSVFRDCPALVNLTLSGDCDIVSHLASLFPWSQITHFTSLGDATDDDDSDSSDLMDSDIWENFETVLPLMVNVEECHLRSFGYTHDTELSSPQTLERLHTLKLTCPQSLESIYRLLDSVTLPSLRALHIVADSTDSLCTSIHRLLCRSQCTVEDFKIVAADYNIIVEILKIPELQRICQLGIGGFSESRLTSQRIMKVLEVEDDGSEGTIMPHLQLLRLTDVSVDEDTNAAIVKMLSSRQKQPSSSDTVRLEEVRFGEEGRFRLANESVLDAVRNLVTGGLVIRDPVGLIEV
ncbi:hypothetical protein AAF712_004865 [Marasmius tenuissimus]|uniref:F-box domain-containing protein n=1 Tax=Marasmius tenuissimus TaxID=585030 RepID=A0ABR3A5Z2_9AGAR